MRQLALLPNEEQARQFTAYLITEGIASHAEEDGTAWAIWVREEDDLEPAIALHQQYLSEPDHHRYSEAVQIATTLLREEAKRLEQTQKNYVEMRGRWKQPGAARRRPLTKLLIGLSILITLLSGVLFKHQDARQPGQKENIWLRHLMFADSELVNQEQRRIKTETGRVELTDQEKQRLALVSLRHNPWELWRLITPIFIHLSWLHLLFNMLWLHDLGSTIENRFGTPRFCLMVVLIAILSVVAQSLAPAGWGPFGGGYNHGGMSGVVYGLFGFAWIRTRFDPGSGIHMRPDTVVLMVAWLFICVLLTQNEILNIANVAHLVGLAAGMAISWATLPKANNPSN